MSFWYTFYIEILALLDIVLLLVTIPWVLMSKKETTSAFSWCLLVIFFPILGSFFFMLFGYQHVRRPLGR